MEEATSIFGTDQIEKAINAIEVYRDAIAEYKEVLKGDKPTYQFQFNPKGNWGLDEYNAKLNAYNQGIGALNDITIKTEVTLLELGFGKSSMIFILRYSRFTRI